MRRGPVYLTSLIGLLFLSTGLALAGDLSFLATDPVDPESKTNQLSQKLEIVRADSVENPSGEADSFENGQQSTTDGDEGSQMLFPPSLENSEPRMNGTTQEDSQIESGGSKVEEKAESVISFNFLYYLLQKFEKKDN